MVQNRTQHAPSNRGEKRAIWMLVQRFLALILVALGVLLIVIANNKNFWEIVLTELGAVLVAVGIIHFAFEHLTRTHLLGYVGEILKEEILGDKELRRAIAQIGIVGARNEMDEREIADLLRKSRSIKVLKTYFPESDGLTLGLDDALKNPKSHVCLYLCDPKATILKQRCEGANVPFRVAGDKVRQAVDMVSKSLPESGTGRHAVMIYDGWPGIPLIYCDHTLWAGSYVIGRPSPNWPWLQIDPDSKFGQKLLAQFDNLPVTHTLNTREKCKDWLA
jgi:hypothetical protein